MLFMRFILDFIISAVGNRDYPEILHRDNFINCPSLSHRVSLHYLSYVPLFKKLGGFYSVSLRVSC